MLKGITDCKYCGSTLEYNENDILIGGDHLGLIELYFICPECGNPVTITVMPSLAAMEGKNYVC